MSTAGGAGGAAATCEPPHDALWRGAALRDAAVRVKRRVPDTWMGRTFCAGVDALLCDSEAVVNLSGCGVGDIDCAARLIASLLATNTAAEWVK